MATTARVKLTLDMLRKLDKGEAVTFRIPEGIREVQIVRDIAQADYIEEMLRKYGLTEKRDDFAAIFMEIFNAQRKK